MAKAISVRDLINQVSQLCPPGTPIPSELWVRLNFCLRNEMMLQAINEISEMVLMAFATITQTDCLGWLEHCGY